MFRHGKKIMGLRMVLAAAVLSMPLIATADAPGIRIGERVPVSEQQFQNDPANFQFVVVGDRTGGHRPGVFENAMRQVNGLLPEFVIGVGDLIEGYTEVAAELDAEWGEVEGFIDQLDMPFFYVVGNHDIGNNAMRDLWNQRKGADYYHFLYRDVLFIALNTEDPPTPMSDKLLAGMEAFKQAVAEGPEAVQALMANSDPAMEAEAERLNVVNISADQVEYVERVLAEHTDARWTLLFMHKPAWKYDSANFERIEALLGDRAYTMFSGHYHYYEHTRRNDRDYIAMGKTGGAFHREGPGDIDHIMWVTMTGDGPRMVNIELDGLQSLDASAEPVEASR